MAGIAVFGVLALAAIATAPWIAEAVREWRLDKAASRGRYRAIAGRISGVGYLELRAAQPRGNGDDEVGSQLDQAVREVLDHSPSPHLRGKALLLSGEPSRAVEKLREAAKGRDPEVLSDLAAALVEEAKELDAYGPALDAVVAARKAIETSDLPAAHYNLGSALDLLGLTSEAREEFEKAAAGEPQSEWASDARRHVRRLSVQMSDWSVIENLLLSTNDEAAQKLMIRERTEEARFYGERYLTEWGEHRKSSPEAANRYLGLARSIGSVLLERHEDRFIAEAVDGIDRARARGEQDALQMADALVTYQRGRSAKKDLAEATAITELARAEKLFSAMGSPLQYSARYYRAGALYEEQQIEEALRELESLERVGLVEKRYPGLAAQLGWNWGSCLLASGDYAAALDQFNRAHDRSVDIGALGLAAIFDGFAANALEYLGRSREAWQRRSRALRVFSPSPRTQGQKLIILTTAANLQLAAREPARASVILDYAIPLALALENFPVAVNAFAQRSIARDEMGDKAGASDDRARGEAWVNRIKEAPSTKERAKVELGIAEGVAKRVSKPAEAIAHFDGAIELLRKSGQTATLPRLHLERARAHEAAGNSRAMRGDLREGLAVVARWESSVSDYEQRAAIKIWSEVLRRELISAELTSGNVSAAFAASEDRHTALTRPDRTRLMLGEIQRALAPGAAILKLTTSRDRVIAFIIRSDSARADTLPFSAARIAAAAEDFRNEDESFPTAAAAMYDLILAPIRDHLRGVTTLAVIPNQELTGISFNGFLDSREDRYLGESKAVVHNDTADDAIVLSQRSRAQYGSTFLAIGASVFNRERNPGAASLSAVEGEAKSIVQDRSSPHSRLLLGERATPQSVRQELLAGPGGLHFAGHIVGRGKEAQFLLAPSGDKDSLTAREIAALSLERTRFVVLAACRGSGTSEPAAIVRDMATGFLRAGVPTVIASATDVDDATATPTMRRLHGFLSSGGDVADALRQTARHDRRQTGKVPLSVRLMVVGGTQSLVK